MSKESIDHRPVAIVTGGGRNIGAAAASLLAERGWAVAVCDLDGAQAGLHAERIAAAGGLAAGFQGDVTDEDDVSRLVAEVTETMAAPTGLVNNVGLTANQTLLDTTMEDWNRTLNSCLTSSMLCMRAVVPGMIDAGRGAIVNVASTTGHRGNPGKFAYGVAKAGVLNMTRSAAVELARYGIRVNTVTPALTGSPVGMDDSHSRDGAPKNIPLGRWGEPVDQAQAIAFLLSDAASFVTGAELLVDGGVLAAYPKVV